MGLLYVAAPFSIIFDPRIRPQEYNLLRISPLSPRKRTVSGDVGRFLFSKANPQTRRGQGGDADAPYAEISQERMGVLSWRLRTEEI